MADINIWGYAIISTFIISLISLIGVFFLALKQASVKKIVLFLVSFSAGALFGDAFIHLLPEAVEESGFGIFISLSLLSGIVLFFIIEKFIHWHHCHQTPSKHHPHPFALMNLIGDSVHNFIDGLIIGASYLVSVPVGVATTVAVLLHEIPQEIGDFGVLIHGGFSASKAMLINFMTAVTAVLGTIVALVLSDYVPGLSAFLVPFAAGSFIYIAGSDLIPELHKEVGWKKSAAQLFTFVLGIVVMMSLLLLE